jgi:hypothetical protein
MSYTFDLKVGGWAPDGIQRSLLNFISESEASMFALKMFEPPESVREWKIVETDEPVNFKVVKVK